MFADAYTVHTWANRTHSRSYTRHSHTHFRICASNTHMFSSDVAVMENQTMNNASVTVREQCEKTEKREDVRQYENHAKITHHIETQHDKKQRRQPMTNDTSTCTFTSRPTSFFTPNDHFRNLFISEKYF